MEVVILITLSLWFSFTAPPVIKLQPAKSIEVNEGHPIVLEVKAECRSGQPVYQWFKRITGQDKGTLLIKNAAVANTGCFFCSYRKAGTVHSIRVYVQGTTFVVLPTL
jgi:hypothetical protein